MASTTMTSPSRILSIYRTLLREVTQQTTKANNNPYWKQQLTSTYRANKTLSDSESIRQWQLKAENTLSFLQGSRKHKELLDIYWPVSQLSEEERLSRTAQRVGLSLPKMLDDDPDLVVRMDYGENKDNVEGSNNGNGQEEIDIVAHQDPAKVGVFGRMLLKEKVAASGSN